MSDKCKEDLYEKQLEILNLLEGLYKELQSKNHELHQRVKEAETKAALATNQIESIEMQLQLERKLSSDRKAQIEYLQNMMKFIYKH